MSGTQPLGLPFTFVVPTELLTVSCICRASEYNNRHLDLRPTVGDWNSSDDLGPAMYSRHRLGLTNFRSKIHYRQSPFLEQGEKNNGSRNIGACPNLVSVQLVATPVFWQHKSNS